MALAWKAGWVNALRGSNPLSSASAFVPGLVARPACRVSHQTMAGRVRIALGEGHRGE